MTPDVDPPSPPRLVLWPRRGGWTLALILGACIAVEVILQLSDLGVLPGRLRRMAYDSGGFWPGLMRAGWRPNYPAQPWTMFLSYGFLHGGLSHLLVNMVTLWSLGIGVIARVGARGFLALYGAALLGGGVGFGLLAATLQPMVGASGALFGLMGGLLAWAYVDRFSARARLWPVLRTVLLLVVLNFVLWWTMDGQLAWETHLGGFITGWVAALLIDPRPRQAEPEAASHSDPGNP